jgi:predicted oxidoreductase
MRYHLLGNSGLRVSEACLGTMTFGDSLSWGADRETARDIYSVFRDAGGTFVDTADIYSDGESEMRRQIVLNGEPAIRRERLGHLFEKQNVALRVAPTGDYHCGLSSRRLEGAVHPEVASQPVI